VIHHIHAAASCGDKDGSGWWPRLHCLIDSVLDLFCFCFKGVALLISYAKEEITLNGRPHECAGHREDVVVKFNLN
jgi:hypothetical protein